MAGWHGGGDSIKYSIQFLAKLNMHVKPIFFWPRTIHTSYNCVTFCVRVSSACETLAQLIFQTHLAECATVDRNVYATFKNKIKKTQLIFTKNYIELFCKRSYKMF